MVLVIRKSWAAQQLTARKKTLIMVNNMEFASRRAHGNNHAKRVGAMDARRDFFLADVMRNPQSGWKVKWKD
jgi:hypothetical protein